MLALLISSRRLNVEVLVSNNARSYHRGMYAPSVLHSPTSSALFAVIAGILAREAALIVGGAIVVVFALVARGGATTAMRTAKRPVPLARVPSE